MLMALLVFFHGWGESKVLGVLGFSVIWLNVLAFILSSMLVKTNLAKRIALAMIVRFGRTSQVDPAAFFVLNLLLAAFIPATAARAAILLPIIIVVASIYGASNKNPNNFGRNLFLQNLQGINFGSQRLHDRLQRQPHRGGLHPVHGRQPDLLHRLAVRVVPGGGGGHARSAGGSGPASSSGSRPTEQTPVVEGGLERMQEKLHEMGPVTAGEKKAAAIFGLVIVLWVTDKLHMRCSVSRSPRSWRPSSARSSPCSPRSAC